MDQEFIELEHRENVLKLMEICGLEMKEAYELYIDSGYNFEAAVNKKFNPIPSPQQNSYQPDVPNIPEVNFLQNPPIINNQIYDDDEDYKYSEYKRFIANGKSYDKKYPVRKHQSLFERIIPRFFKGDEEDPFKKSLEKYIEKRNNLKNTVGNLSEVLQWSWKEKYPALIMILDFFPDQKQNVKRIFSDEMFVQQVLNQQFKVFGLDVFSYELEDELKLHFNFERDVNHLIVCRVNHLEEIEIMHRIKVSQPYEELKRKLKLVKSECIQVEMEESNIVKQFQEERRGNFNYRRPKTIKENIKLKEDKKIRKQQEQEFFKACVPKSKVQKPAANEQYTYKPIEKKQVQKVEEKIEYKQQISEEKLRKIREQKFNALKKYNSGLSFKIRVPSGSNIVINVDGEQLVQYLFDYISYQPSDLGFANNAVRDFDIFVGFGGSEKLRGKQKEQLKTLFQDSQVLIVREMGE